MAVVYIYIGVFALLCIVVAGILGGTINCLQDDASKGAGGNAWRKACAYQLLLSTGAAATVPLFLGLIQSRISTQIFSVPTEINLEYWFEFFALCVVAAIFAKKFLAIIYDKMAQELKETKEKLDKTAALAKKAETAADEILANQRPDDAAKKLAQAPLPANLSADEQKVATALMDPAYPRGRRSPEGIAPDAELDLQTVQAILDKLEAAGLVEKVRGERTKKIYYRWRGTGSGT